MGAGKWRNQYHQYLEGKHVVLIPDNDDEGRNHMQKVAISLHKLVASLKVLELPGLTEKQDVSDYIATFNDPQEASERLSILISNAEPIQPKTCLSAGEKIRGYTAAELMKMDLPEPKWAIPGILPEGFNLLAGKPKHGKSIMALNFGIAISGGHKAFGKIEIENGTVLYLALEDTPTRLKKRLNLMYADEDRPSEKLLLFTEWPRMGQGGIKLIEEQIKENPDMRLIMIDTLPKFRPPQQKSISSYDFDYQVGVKLKDFADKYQVPLMVICHLRKMESEDRMDDISGTFGVTGSADGILALVRRTGQADAELHVTGRDVEAAEYALKFDNTTLSWNLMGKAEEVKNTEQQQILYDAIKDYGHPLSPKEMKVMTGLDLQYIKNTLPKLLKQGNITKAGYGKYLSIETDDSGYSDV